MASVPTTDPPRIPRHTRECCLRHHTPAVRAAGRTVCLCIGTLRPTVLICRVMSARRYGRHANCLRRRLLTRQTDLMVRFHLAGDVSSDDLATIRPVLIEIFGHEAVTETHDGLHVEGVMEGTDARDVNRRLLSALRRAEKRTRLRAEWTGGGHIARFFDYVPKSMRDIS